MARQGWKPNTPIQLLYKTWAQTDLEIISLEDWVVNNRERVEAMSEKYVLGITESGLKRKEKWDQKAKEREFEIGEQILLRKACLNFKLEESWEGPYNVYRKNSPLSYGIDTGERKIVSVHVQLLKKYRGNDEVLKVGRATTVLEQDDENDDITDRYAEVTVLGATLTKKQKKDILDIEKRHENTLTKEPGLTNLVEFKLDTGDSLPLSQCPYNTPYISGTE